MPDANNKTKEKNYSMMNLKLKTKEETFKKI